MRDDVPHAFQPNMLATLELQCRSFMSGVGLWTSITLPPGL